MKKSWKKILCSLMLAPCMFWATACGDNPEDPNNLTVDLTVEQQQEAYTTLRTLAANAFNNDGTKDQHYQFVASKEARMERNIDNAGLTANNSASVGDSFALNTSNKTIRSVYAGYKANNTGYMIDTLKSVSSETGTKNINSVSEIVKYNGQYYELYKNENEEKTLSKINNVYAKENIIMDAGVLTNDNVSSADLVEIFTDFENQEDFSMFRSNLINWVSTNIALNKIENAEELDFSDYITTTYAFSMTGDVYTLKVDMSMDTSSGVFLYLDDGILYGSGSLNVVFDSNKIRQVAFNYSANMVLEESSASFFEGLYQQEFNATDKVVTTNSYIVNMGIDFTTAFDNNFYNQDVSGYLGTGANGEVENNRVNATIMFIDNDVHVPSLDVKLATGENYIAKVREAIDSSLLLYNVDAIAYWHWVDNGVERELVKIEDDALVPDSDVVVFVYFAKDNTNINSQA